MSTAEEGFENLDIGACPFTDSEEAATRLDPGSSDAGNLGCVPFLRLSFTMISLSFSN